MTWTTCALRICGDDPRLLQEALDEAGATGKLRVQHLDGNPGTKNGVLGLVDRAHPAVPQNTDEPVLAVDYAADVDHGSLRASVAPWRSHPCQRTCPATAETFEERGRGLATPADPGLEPARAWRADLRRCVALDADARNAAADLPDGAQDATHRVRVVDGGKDWPQGVVSVVASEGATRRECTRLWTVKHEKHVVQLPRRCVDHVRDS